MEKQKLIYVESKALFSPSSVSNKAIVFIKDTKEIWTHGTYFICSNVWATPITLTLSGDSTGSVSIDGSGNVTLSVTNKYLDGTEGITDANNAVLETNHKVSYYARIGRNASNLFPWSNNANAILTLNTHYNNYNHQLGFSSNKGIYHRTRNGGTWETSWREILTSTNYTKYPHTFASLTNKPTTISGYGITDSIPIISGDIVTTDTDLSTLGMTTFGAKFSISRTNNVNTPSWGYGYSNYLIFRSTGDTYSGISTDFSSGMVTFIGGRNLETTANNVPNWWFRIKGASGTTYDLNSFLNIVDNLSNYVTTNTYQAITGYKIFRATAPADDREAVYYNIGLKLTSYGDNHKKVAAIGMGNEYEYQNWYKAAIGFERTGTYDRGDIVLLFNNITDQTTCAYSDIKVRINAAGNISTLGTISASGFKKTDSSDSYVLLGGGGHKLLSDLSMSHTHSYLPLSGGTMTGKIQMTRGAAYLNDTGTDYSMLGMINSGTSTTGMNSEEGMFINVPFTLATLRTSGNNLWHYNHANSARYLILDANNYTNYTIPYSKVNVTNGALGAFIYNGNLLYNNNFKYLTFFPSDNLGHTSYVLIAKIDNWANTANATSAISYGINGLFIAYRSGNMANTGSYFVTNVAYVNTNYKNYKLYFSEARSDLLVPLLVIYLGEYYLAFKKDGSSTDYHFYGQVFNILPSFIYVNDASLITLVSGPFVTATTGLYYYNEGNGFKKFLHEGNYSNYALPLSGGTMTGNITWNTDSHGVYFYGGCGIEKWSGYGPTLIAEINTDFYIRNSTDRADYHKIIHTGNYSSYALPLSGGTMTGALNFKNNTWNKVGDDAYIGDCNVAGMIGIKGSNADTPGFAMYNSGGTLLGKLYASGTNLYWAKGSETVNNIILHSGNYSEYALKIDGSNGTSNGVSTLLNKLTVESINPQDADYYICQYAGGSTATTTYHRRPTSALYSYIRAKLYNSTSNYFIMGNGDLLSKEDVYSIGSYTAVKNSYYTGNAMYYYWYKIEFPESSSGSASATYSIMINDDNNYPRFSHYILNIKRYYANNIYGNSYQLTHLGGTSLNIMLWIANDSTPNLYILCPCAYGEYGLRIKCIYGTNKFNPTPVEYNNGGVASSFTIINKYLDLCSVRVDNTGVVTHTYGNIIKTDIVGNVTGTATSANKLNTNAGNSTTPVYFSNGIPVTCTDYGSAYVHKANLLASLDLRNKYPALIVTAGLNIGASFMTASKLGISGDGSYYDTLIIRGYSDSSGGKENAIMFGKNTSSVYHSQYDFGSTTTWGTLYKFLDSGNYKNYAPSLSGEGATGTWGISISGAANKVANALTLQLNGGTTAGTNKFVYDGASAYTINITPDSIGAAASSHTHSYLPLSGGKLGSATASYTDLYIKSSTAMLRLTSFTDSTTYIQSGNSDFTGNATLKITGYNVNTGSNLYFNFANIYCRGSNYINIDSGNYGSYALPLSGGTMTGAINTANIYPKSNAGFNIGSTSSYYNTMYAYYFKKYGSDDNYLLLGGGGHKKISDFPLILDKGIEGGNGGNTDNWVLVLNNNYSTGWYGPCTMFYIRSKNFGCGILCFYHYWNTEGTSGYYDNSVWFFGAEHSAYSVTMGGMGRDINNYLKVYIDKENADLKIYYNRYNNLALNVQELLFVHGPSGTLYPSGELRASHFINSTLVVELPTTSNTFVNIPILTVKNHTEDIKTTRSVYASAFYENSDIRLKENVHSIDLIDLLKNVDLVLFNFKNDLNKKYGVIAQQLEQVGLNNLVYEHNGNKAVDYISLLVLETLRLRNEIKELKEKLDKKELSS